jgi:hypothetical protein
MPRTPSKTPHSPVQSASPVSMAECIRHAPTAIVNIVLPPPSLANSGRSMLTLTRGLHIVRRCIVICSLISATAEYTQYLLKIDPQRNLFLKRLFSFSYTRPGNSATRTPIGSFDLTLRTITAPRRLSKLPLPSAIGLSPLLLAISTRTVSQSALLVS